MIQLIFGFLKITVDLKNLSRNSTEKCFELTKQYFRSSKREYKITILLKFANYIYVNFPISLVFWGA